MSRKKSNVVDFKKAANGEVVPKGILHSFGGVFQKKQLMV